MNVIPETCRVNKLIYLRCRNNMKIKNKILEEIHHIHLRRRILNLYLPHSDFYNVNTLKSNKKKISFSPTRNQFIYKIAMEKHLRNHKNMK